MRFSKVKKFAAAILAVATVMATGIVGAGAVDTQAATSDTVTANLYVDAEHSFKGVDSYLTPSSAFGSSLQFPIKGTTNNATLTVDGTAATLVVPVTNNIFKFEGFGSATGKTATSSDGAVTAQVTGTDSDGYVDEITFTYDTEDFENGDSVVFENCYLYAKPALITGTNAGEHVMPVTLKLG